MKRIVAFGMAAVLAAGGFIASGAVANAAPYWYYHRPYYHHYYGHYYGPGPAIGAGILGFAAGAAIAGAAADRGRDVTPHVDACFAAYKSYDPRSDTYLGYDGYRHRCLL